MPNIEQPQGLTKTISNPTANADGKFVVDFKMPEDSGIATASHLALLINDGAARTAVDVIFDPALLRTRFDTVHVEVISNVATNLNVYALLKPEDVVDYTQATKRVLAVEADKPVLFAIKKLDSVIVFDGADIDRIQTTVAPENGGAFEL
ncbi:hypothetical protein [Psychrobacter sp. KCTC 72983]|uniref:hypothetical protein n=1 Tax=Psychrobacter sp. KCTC 72983 TaxID=2733866 RepID=UPI001648454B|nr:hypothetical protein [Psychrobacter sp. KCTC 72983]